MGYMSEWMLVSQGSAHSIKRLAKWIGNGTRRGAHGREVFQTIMECQVDVQKVGKETRIIWWDACTKCTEPWDEVLDDVMEQGREQFNLKMAYSRIGEDRDDYHEDCEHGFSIYWSKKLLGPDYPVVDIVMTPWALKALSKSDFENAFEEITIERDRRNALSWKEQT